MVLDWLRTVLDFCQKCGVTLEIRKALCWLTTAFANQYMEMPKGQSQYHELYQILLIASQIFRQIFELKHLRPVMYFHIQTADLLRFLAARCPLSAPNYIGPEAFEPGK